MALRFADEVFIAGSLISGGREVAGGALRMKISRAGDAPSPSFITLALVNMLSELRKYRVGFTVAHQYLHQLESDIRHAVLGNAGTIISSRVGAEDAPYTIEEFHEHYDKLDFLSFPTTASTSSS
jgi:hypothetical protein